MSIKSLEEAQEILKKHYTSQQKVVDESGAKMDMLWVSMKYTHSQDVFKISQYLIENDEVLKKLDNKYKLYGQLSALLHDIGRAYEVGDMKEKVKPHGYYGADIVLKQVEKENNPFILIPVKYHGDLKAEENARKELEEIDNLSDEEKEIVIMLLKLVMDSDKLANFELFKIISEEKYFLSKKQELFITDACYECFLKRGLVKRGELQTIFDEILFYLGWIYDLNYEASKKLIFEEKLAQAYVDRMETKINILAKNSSPEQVKKINKQFEQVKKQLIEDKLI